MLFFEQQQETALTSAVLSNDLEKLLKLGNSSFEQSQRNSLGFNGLELAQLLDKKECLNILNPLPSKNFKVKLKCEKNFSILKQEEFEKEFQIQYLNLLKFRNYDFFIKVIHSCSDIYLSKPKTIPVTQQVLDANQSAPEIFLLRGEFYRDKIYGGFQPALKIEWIDEQIGYGLFADQEIKKGSYIGTYAGEVRKTAFWMLQNDYSVFYPNLGFCSYTVDGKKQGNELRFSNHSRANANMEPHVAAHHGITHIIYLANRDIAEGEQLFWNYGDDFWASREPPQE